VVSFNDNWRFDSTPVQRSRSGKRALLKDVNVVTQDLENGSAKRSAQRFRVMPASQSSEDSAITER
jgi:hypothetical protein